MPIFRNGQNISMTTLRQFTQSIFPPPLMEDTARFSQVLYHANRLITDTQAMETSDVWYGPNMSITKASDFADIVYGRDVVEKALDKPIVGGPFPTDPNNSGSPTIMATTCLDDNNQIYVSLFCQYTTAGQCSVDVVVYQLDPPNVVTVATSPQSVILNPSLTSPWKWKIINTGGGTFRVYWGEDTILGSAAYQDWQVNATTLSPSKVGTIVYYYRQGVLSRGAHMPAIVGPEAPGGGFHYLPIESIFTPGTLIGWYTPDASTVRMWPVPTPAAMAAYLGVDDVGAGSGIVATGNATRSFDGSVIVVYWSSNHGYFLCRVRLGVVVSGTPVTSLTDTPRYLMKPFSGTDIKVSVAEDPLNTWVSLNTWMSLNTDAWSRATVILRISAMTETAGVIHSGFSGQENVQLLPNNNGWVYALNGYDFIQAYGPA